MTNVVEAAPIPALAEPAPGSMPIADKIWRVPVIYSNEKSSVIQEFRFVGRLNLDAYNVDSNIGTDEDWVVRRLRAGAKMKFLHDFLLHVEADFSPQDPTPFYSRLTDAYIAWNPVPAFRLAVGKLAVEFGLDGSTSSNELLTLERNNVSNNLWFPQQYISGVNISGKAGAWQWSTGIYSGGTVSPEFGNFDAGNFWLASIGYDFAKQLGVNRALLRADYVYNDPHPESDATRPFENIGALVFQLDAGRWGVSAEVTAGQGFGTQSDAFGTSAMPWFMLTDRLQFVTRYTYIASADPHGVRFNRYENVLTSAKGDEYQEFYVGLNYYIYGHRLKLQTGLEYVSMRDSLSDGGNYRGWSWVSGLRVYF